ncbi:MAG TPA: hypothetical protein VFZ09_30090 [Archangium sp.]|uniref:hypothetical protein n=1 Tax=Archangium sp. TaxID=1872627 RepID=UPI002E33866C|nr:hypothetical protein [Archangium sp.]HEX5750517.1 hypothetical protein [Archangium sp.]
MPGRASAAAAARASSPLSIDAAAARVAQDINARARAADNPGPSQDTSWEARVERGEEWEEQDDKASDPRDEKTASPVDRDRKR